jgi:hypothetical protein
MPATGFKMGDNSVLWLPPWQRRCPPSASLHLRRLTAPQASWPRCPSQASLCAWPYIVPCTVFSLAWNSCVVSAAGDACSFGDHARFKILIAVLGWLDSAGRPEFVAAHRACPGTGHIMPVKQLDVAVSVNFSWAAAMSATRRRVPLEASTWSSWSPKRKSTIKN